MTEAEVRNTINQLGINDNTNVQVECFENNITVSRTMRINFLYNTNLPAISNGNLGVRIQAFEGSRDFRPIVGGISLESIISISLSNE
jgi:hypothetical protein